MSLFLKHKRVITLTALLGVTNLLAGESTSEDRSFGISATTDQESLSLTEYMQRVVGYNDSVQGQVLGFKAARYQRDAEKGAFEPTFVASTEFIDRDQPNNFQLERSLGFLNGQDPGGYPSIFLERNWSYSSAIEMATPVGTRFRLGVTGRELRNNVPRPAEFLSADVEFETSVGVSVEQPLLKGLGYAVNLASLRLAARQSEVVFQEYRRELMQVVAEAEVAYWNLFYAQEELKLSKESVALAQTLLDDSQASLDAGRGSKLDVLEAEAGLALRQSRERESMLRRVEAANNLASFFGRAPRETQIDIVVTDAPVSEPVEMIYGLGVGSALVMNPDLLRIQLQREQEMIRLGVAKNQRLPELNLNASYGASGLGFDWETSMDDIQRSSFPSWTVGVVFRAPILGDVRGRNQLMATRLRLMQADRVESNLITQIRVGCDTAEQRVKSNYTTARSLESVVDFRTNLLETRMQSRDLGRMDSRSVLEAEQELFVARLEQLNSENQYQRGLLELQLISGILLQLRNLEMSFEDLDDRRSADGEEKPGTSSALVYQLPEFTRLPAEDPILMDGDDVQAPWFGHGGDGSFSEGGSYESVPRPSSRRPRDPQSE